MSAEHLPSNPRLQTTYFQLLKSSVFISISAVFINSQSIAPAFLPLPSSSGPGFPFTIFLGTKAFCHPALSSIFTKHLAFDLSQTFGEEFYQAFGAQRCQVSVGDFVEHLACNLFFAIPFFCSSIHSASEMGEYSLSEYYYTSPCSWIEETRHGWAKKSLASDIDFALSCFDHGAFAFDDFLSTGDKWLRRAESSFFSTHFRSTEREPYAITERIAAVKRTTPFTTTIRKVRSTTAEGWDSSGERVEKTEFSRGGEDYLHELDDRIAALEVGFDNLFDFKASKNQKPCKKESKAQNGRKAEISYKYLSKRVTDPFTVTHPFPADFSTCRAEAYTLSRPSEPQTRVIPVEDGERSNLARSKKIQNVFARKRAVAAELKGKRKELSPQDAALIIQARFREYLVHRSQTLRVLKELAVAKARLKELRTLFSNYTYRRHLSRDPEERQRFSEKIIVLLLTVDSIPGLDYMVREARRSMIQELESMLAAVDPQASNKAGSSRRKFDLPEPGTVHKEMTMEVSEVVGMLDEQNEGNVFPYVTM